jgi:disulfide bond formation protein DsbB
MLKMPIVKFSSRFCFFLGFVACASLLGGGAYLQFVEGLEPCPLCISQRLAILATGIVFLLAAIHGRGRQGYAVLAGLTALIGACISIRHIWIQHLPADEVPECGPGLEYVFNHFPLADTIKMMLSGTGDCAKIDWTLLGFSIPVWTLLAFLSLAGLAFLQFSNTRGAN